MLQDATKIQCFVISAHPYAFDTMFIPAEAGRQWTGAGRVKFQSCWGGVNEVKAFVEADYEGLAGLQKVGFSIRVATAELSVGWSGKDYLVP
jgi:hypothetical protein